MILVHRGGEKEEELRRKRKKVPLHHIQKNKKKMCLHSHGVKDCRSEVSPITFTPTGGGRGQ